MPLIQVISMISLLLFISACGSSSTNTDPSLCLGLGQAACDNIAMCEWENGKCGANDYDNDGDKAL